MIVKETKAKHSSLVHASDTLSAQTQYRSERRASRFFQTGGILLSLAGILVCGRLGLGAGRVLCHGLLVAALGAPVHRATRRQIGVR